MMFQVVVEFALERDPVRQRHGLRRLLDYAHWLEHQQEHPGVRPLSPIVWGCEQPIGFGLYEADDAQELHAMLAHLHNTTRVSVIPCKYLDEVMQLAEVRLAAMRAAGEPVGPPAAYG